MKTQLRFCLKFNIRNICGEFFFKLDDYVDVIVIIMLSFGEFVQYSIRKDYRNFILMVNRSIAEKDVVRNLCIFSSYI